MRGKISVLIVIIVLMSSINVFGDSLSGYGDYIYNSYDGIRKVREPSDSNLYQYGYIDEEGNVIAECKYDNASDFVNGLGILKDGNIITTVNKKGERVKTFDSSFSDVSYFDGEKGIAKKNGMDYIIDKDGKIVSKSYQTLSYDPFSPFRGVLAKNNDKYGVIDWDGNILTPFDYADLWDNGGNTTGVIAAEKQLYGIGNYIGINGRALSSPIYDFLGGFDEERGRLGTNEKYGVIDAQGNQITGLIYDNISPYSEGLAAVLKGDKWGYIDRNGNVVIPFVYEYANDFLNGQTTAMKPGSAEETIVSPIKQARKINVFYNDQWLYLDQELVLENNRALAPIRGIAEALGYDVTWDAESKIATLQNRVKIIKLTLDSKEAVVNTFDDQIDPEIITLDSAAQNIHGRIFVPVRFIAENIGANVSWNQTAKGIDICIND